MNNTTQSPYDDDFEEYYYYDTAYTNKRTDFTKLIKFFFILRECKVAVAVIGSFFGLFLLLSLFREDIRRRSILWYTSHLTLAIAFTGLSVHLASRADLHRTSYNACLFMTYGAHYIFFLMGYNIILINIETIFTVLFPHRLWESNKGLRFAVSILITWIVACLCVAHILIQNNTATKSRYHCIVIRDKDVLKIRLVFRDYFPTGIVFVLTLIAIGLHCIHQKRVTMATDLQPLETRPVEWLRFLVTMNSIFIVHVILMPFAKVVIPRRIEYYYLHFLVSFLNVLTFYLVPLPVLLLGEMRTALWEVLKKIWKYLCGRHDDPFKDLQPLNMSGDLNTNND